MTGRMTLGIDIGTSAVKACILDNDTGKVVAASLQPHPLDLPAPGYAEQTGESYWVAVSDAIRDCLSQGAFADEVVGVAISGLVGVMLPIDKDGIPVRPGMIWMDARSEEECEDIRKAVGEEAINWNNGNRIACWFVEPKALWMKKHEPELFEKTYKFLSPAGYCTYRLSGQFTINKGDAGLFYPYDYQKGVWNEELAEKIGVPIEKYPKIYDCDEPVGTVTAEAAKETGLREGVIVVAGGTDISSAALGCGVYTAGQAYYSMGTGSNLGIMIPTEQRTSEFRILKWPHVIPGLTMYDAPMAFTGASLNWFKDKFASHEVNICAKTGQSVFAMLDREAEKSSSPGANGLLYLPYLGNVLAPRWNPSGKGVFFGVTLSTTREDMIRAILEGVAYDLYSNFKTAVAAGVQIEKLTLNGGPTKSMLWDQTIADILGVPLETTDVDEAAPFGDAILAAKGAGIYNDLIEPVKQFVHVTGRIEPNMELHKRYEDFFEVWTSVYEKLMPEMDAHHKLLVKYQK